MHDKPCPVHSTISILQWKADPNPSVGPHWHQLSANSQDLHTNSQSIQRLASAQEPVSIVFASASKIRHCSYCLTTFQQSFCMPDIWWSDYCENSNGYFGTETREDSHGIEGFNTWVYFEVKHLDLMLNYGWEKLNIFVRWIPSTKHTVIIIFDPSPPIAEQLKKSLTGADRTHWVDPFWPYMSIAGELVRLQDSAVWAIRDHVRGIEKEKTPEGKPEPDYRRLHDIARHAIHVVETLDVGILNMEGIMSQHEAAREEVVDHKVWQAVDRRLAFFKQMVGSLRHRSESNSKRLANELQLTFNMVSQYDSGVSVAIGQVAQLDSAAMRTVSSLTLIFLPPTFICAVFSMSFFKFEDDTGRWVVSDKFWIYWACAVPTMIITSVLWYFWHNKIVPVGHFKQDQGCSPSWRRLLD